MSYTTEDIILKTLAGKNPAEEATVDELIGITKKYPAFGAAKYLAAKKMKQAQHESYEKYAQNAVLYFTNPFWFHFKLSEEELMLDDTFLTKKGTNKNGAPTDNAEPGISNIQIAPPSNEPAEPEVAIEAQQPSAEETFDREEEAATPLINTDTVADEQPPEFLEIVPEEHGEAPAEEQLAVLNTPVEAVDVEAKEELPPVEQVETMWQEQPAEQQIPEEAVAVEAKEEYPAVEQVETALQEQPAEHTPGEAVAVEAKEERPPVEQVETALQEQPAEHTPEETVAVEAKEERPPVEQVETALQEQPAEHTPEEAVAVEAKEEHSVEQAETPLQEQPTEQHVPVEAVAVEAKEGLSVEQFETALQEQPAEQHTPVEAVEVGAKEEHPVEQAETPLQEQPTEQHVPVEAVAVEAKEELPVEQFETALQEQPAEQHTPVEAVAVGAKEEHPVEQAETPLQEQPTEQHVPVEAVAVGAKEEHPVEQAETPLQEQPTEQHVPVEAVAVEAKEELPVEQFETALQEQPKEQHTPVEAVAVEAKEELPSAEQAEILLPEQPTEQQMPVETVAVGGSQVEQQEPALSIEINTNKAEPRTAVEEYAPKFADFERPDNINDRVPEELEDPDAEMESMMPPLSSDRITSVLQEQLADFKKPVTEDTPVPIENEPYHTIDYFASQGIKLTLEQQSQDHLSVKVKKFTDWLKQMKRINPAPVDLGIDEAMEHRVQNIAAGSNEPREVLTEAMAEVLAKQGMTEKAIQVYIKLSFLYPSKSAYFASQIEQLKGI